MPLFGKAKISERDAAALFVRETLAAGESQWPAVVDQLSRMVGEDVRRLKEDPWVSLEFALASLATQSAALPNLLPADQAKRILGWILEFLDSPNLNGKALDTFDAYFQSWYTAVAQNEIPFNAVASLLFDRIQLGAVTVSQGQQFQSPLAVMALAGAVTTAGGAWWKGLLQKKKLTEK